MKTLNDIRNYAEVQGISGHRLEKLIDEVETDGKGYIPEEYFFSICFGINCEVEEN